MGLGGGVGRSLSVSTFLAALIIAVGLLAPTSAPGPAAALDSEEEAFLKLINDYRVANGVGALSLNGQLSDAARWMSQDMAANNYFSHTDSLGRDPFQRMADFGYTYNTWRGENLAAGIETAQAAFDLFKGSPAHNANMLHANFKVIAIARAYAPGTTFGWYWATEFGGQGEPLPPAQPPAPPPPPPPVPAPLPSPQVAAPPPQPAQEATPLSSAEPAPAAAPQATQEATPQPPPPLPEAAPAPPSWREIASLVQPSWQRLMVLDREGAMLEAISYAVERFLALTGGAFVQEDVPRPDIMLGTAVPGQL